MQAEPAWVDTTLCDVGETALATGHKVRHVEHGDGEGTTPLALLRVAQVMRLNSQGGAGYAGVVVDQLAGTKESRDSYRGWELKGL